jgi:hypothetical protein
MIKAMNGGEMSANLFNSLGMARAQQGDLSGALQAYHQAVKLDPNLKEAYVNIGIIEKESGNIERAIEAFTLCIQLDADYLQALLCYANFHYSMGSYADAAVWFSRHMKATHSIESQSARMAALSAQAMGKYRDALRLFTVAIQTDALGGVASCQLELLFFYWAHLKVPFSHLFIDRSVHPSIKDAWCKGLPWTAPSRDTRVTDLVPSLKAKEIILMAEPSDNSIIWPEYVTVGKIEFVRFADKFGESIQLNSVGFLRNSRQHRMFGLAVVHMASALQSTIFLTSEEFHAVDSTRKFIEWRQFFDIAVKWRQISEPNDPVWWIDGFPTKSFADGFGLETPIFSGQLKVIRYFSYFEKSFSTLKSYLLHPFAKSVDPMSCLYSADGIERPVVTQMQAGYYNTSGAFRLLSESAKEAVKAAQSVEDLWQAVGEDFYVITLCCGHRNSALMMEGTRLTLLRTEPDGFKFCIRTPGTPRRWSQFDEEFDCLFESLRSSLIEIQSSGLNETNTVRIVDLALTVFYYWVVFAPLSRGSAACAYAALHSILLSVGLVIPTKLPHNIQLDWEAILAHDSAAFIEYFKSLSLPIIALCDSDNLGSISFSNILRMFSDEDLEFMFHLLTAKV